MPIPAEILAVQRPRNTFVAAYGKDKDRYAVRAYVGCRYDRGRRIPVKGPTVGHIREGRYVPLAEDGSRAARAADGPVDLKDWADVALCDRLFAPVLEDLRAAGFPEGDALALYCAAILRVCHPGIADRGLRDAYETGFLSELRPGAALSRNSVCALHRRTGRAFSRIAAFMRRRVEALGAKRLLVDGTLKGDDSRVNSLSDFSRKARLKGSRDLSLVWAYDPDAAEPVCAKCYPGNMLDGTAVGDFLEENGIVEGLVVGDKEFRGSATEALRERHPRLHHLNPLKRSTKFVKTHHLREYDGMLPGREGVSFRKVKVLEGKKWLYAYRDAAAAAAEERAWVANARKGNRYDAKLHRQRMEAFGTLVLESDLDLPPERVYALYEERWLIELVMRYYKVADQLDETRVHSDWSVVGSEFCNFLAALLTFRLLKEFAKTEVLGPLTYGRIMKLLARAKKVRLPDNADWRMVKVAPFLEEMLRKLSLLPPAESSDSAAPIPPRQPGRPRKKV
ncbi:MAG: transposase [Kiritimatiellae bacterium]|nr:transposase [Kiritimatiellia bacterium]